VITLRRKVKSTIADEIENEMIEMSLAYSRIYDNNFDIVIEEGGVQYGTLHEIHTYLEEMKKYKSDWEKFQTDACYIDDDGSVC
jgi:hypothetical protein